MKKLITVIFCLTATVIFAKKTDNTGDKDLADVYTVCLGDKGHNTGHCSTKMNGYGSACVKAGFLQGHNCFTSQER